MKTSPAVFWLGLFAILLFSCRADKSSAQEELIIQGQAQGTTYTVKYLGERIEELPARLDSLLEQIDHSLSTYDTSSLITDLNRGDTVLYEQKLWEMIELSHTLSEETSGAFDPTIGPLIRAWGWDLSDAEPMDSVKVDSLLQLKGFKQLAINPKFSHWKVTGPYLNFNAIAQGYAVDLMAELLEAHQIQRYYVELGGELKVKGKSASDQAWKIGIDRPLFKEEKRELIAIVELMDAAMATSGNYRKYYEIDGKKYSHTIDPMNGYPVQHNLLSATVISEHCYRADALATAFMVMGRIAAEEFLAGTSDLAYLIYAKEDGSYGDYISPGLQKKLKVLAADSVN